MSLTGKIALKNLQKAFVILNLIYVGTAWGQEILTTPMSAAANGMGGVDASVISDNAMAIIDNPAQLGIFSLTGIFSGATYSPSTIWAPGSSTQVYRLNASAVSAGISLKTFADVPFNLSIGYGYSKTTLGEGTYYGFQNNDAPFSAPMGEEEQTRSVAVGIEYFIKAAFGYTAKTTNVQQPVVASNGFLVPSDIPGHVHDIGVLLQVPVLELVSRLRSRPILLTHRIAPVLDVTFSYARRNIGGSTTTWIFRDTIPYPRQAIVGLNFQFGLRTHLQSHEWAVFSFTWARQAEDLLYTYNPDIPPLWTSSYAHFIYKTGIGDLKPFQNLILGRTYSQIGLRTGWQLQAGELLYIRGGRYRAIGFVGNSSIGFGLRLDGLVKILAAYDLVDIDRPGIYSFIVDHLDLQYDYSEYTGDSYATGTNFQSLNLVVR